jgi:imidazolonepropionase-like amidohydrolase
MKSTILALICLAACAPRLATPHGDVDLAITNVNVVDVANGRLLPGRTVLITQGVITEIAVGGGTRVPAGALHIDAGGRYLMPA